MTPKIIGVGWKIWGNGDLSSRTSGKHNLPNGQQCMSKFGEKYVKAAVEIIKALLEDDGQELKTEYEHKGPILTKLQYQPWCDKRDGCWADTAISTIIGIRNWAVESGRVDILSKVVLLLAY